jgi:hypothetical protein
MAYPQGSLITTANMISDFNSLVISARNNQVTWATGEGAWGGGASGDPFYPNITLGSLAAWDGDPLGPRTAASVSTSALSNPISATQIYTAFITTATAASTIRTVRLIKYFNTNGSYANNWDNTRVGSMSSAYLTSVASNTNPAAGALVSAANLNAFISSMASSLASIAATGATFNEYYCHSSCHSSCHGSRGRR